MSNNPILSLVPKGHPDHPRFLIANQHCQFWTGNDWSHDEEDGLLFVDEGNAGRVCTEILNESFRDKPVYRFTAPVQVEFRGDRQPDLEEFRLWLIRAVRLYADYQVPGLSDGTTILSIDWNQLKEIE